MSANKLKFPIRSLQTNILILFTITLAAVLLAAYFVRENERVLRKTLNELTNPISELTLLRDILSSLSEAENKLRYYTLTNDTAIYAQYTALIDNIEKDIDVLSVSNEGDTITKNQLDLVKDLMSQRKALIASFIQTKQDQAKFDFTDVAFSTIRKGTPDSLIRRKNISTTIITTYDTIPAPVDSSVVPEKTKGFFGKIKDVFTKNVPTEKEVKIPDPIIRSTTSIQMDTSIVRPSDTMKIGHIEKELGAIKAKDRRLVVDLREKELHMLQNSSLIIDKVTEILNRLEESVLEENERRSAEARSNASRSLFLIGIVTIVSLVIILVLVILILNNLQRSKKYRKELLNANQQANELARVKEEFLANMSHEIRTPLNAIIGFSNQLSNSALNKQQTRYLDAVQISSQHLLEIVNDILDMSRLVAGKFSIDKIPFLIGEVLNDVIKPFQIQAQDKGLQFEENCEYPDNLVLEGDPVRLRQILYNLLSNAIKFTKRGKVSFNCIIIENNDTAKVEIEVEDTGIGISERQLESIFEDFQQIESSSARSYGGSGLGLAISRRLARLQGGDITVESRLDEGSSFKLALEYKVLDKTEGTLLTLPQTVPQWTKNREALKGAKILVVDDDEFNILLTRIITENHSMDIRVAKDGFEAESLIDNEKFDLIMTDLQMPGLSGFDLLAFIRNHHDSAIADIPVIAFTANKKERFDDKLIALGFNEVLQKPFPEDEFLNRISNYIAINGGTDSNPEINDPEASFNGEITYDLSHIEVFAGGKPETLIEILKSFIMSSGSAVETMRVAALNNNYQEIKEISHRLLTTYGHLKVHEAVNILEHLEGMDVNNPDGNKVGSLINMLIELNRRLHKNLEEEIAGLT